MSSSAATSATAPEKCCNEIVDRHVVAGEIVERLEFDAEDDRALHDPRPGRRARDRGQCTAGGPAGARRGIALVAHPHPLQGGTLDNKVAQTLAKTFFALGYASVRFNFRGVGASRGRVRRRHRRDRRRAGGARARAARASARRPAGRAGRVLVRLVRADARARQRASPASGWCWSDRRSAASRSSRSPPTRSSSTARRTTSCRWPTCFAWARPQSAAGRRVSRLRAFLPRPAAAAAAASSPACGGPAP